jgi:hypothetical protein
MSVPVALVNAAQKVLRPAGLEVARWGGSRLPLGLRRVTLPPGMRDPTKGHGDRVFDVDLEHVASYIGFSYADAGWHPYVAALEQYRTDPRTSYGRSVLARLHAAYQPRNVQEILLEGHRSDIEPLSSWPPQQILARNIWTLTERHVRAVVLRSQRKRPPLDGTEERNLAPWYGPVDDEFGSRQLSRLVRTYESIRERGFRADLFGHIEGFFLVRGDGYRFIVRSGNHRVAVLKTLGARRIPVRLVGGVHPSTIDYDRLNDWSDDRGGLLPRAVAVMLFEKQMGETGRSKAARLGIF